MLDTVNRLFVKLQRYVQGIPAGAAHFYEKVVTKYLEQSYKNIAEKIGQTIKEDSRILEIGCGTGKLLIEILKKMEINAIIGLDISKAMIGISRKNLVKSYMYGFTGLILADAHKIPLRDACIDLIVSTGTLHHIRKPRVLFEECARILRENGEAWIYELSHDVPRPELVNSSKKLKRWSFLLRTSATLHGIPRKAYEAGYIGEALKKAKLNYRIEYDGVITKLIISKADF